MQCLKHESLEQLQLCGGAQEQQLSYAKMKAFLTVGITIDNKSTEVQTLGVFIDNKYT